MCASHAAELKYYELQFRDGESTKFALLLPVLVLVLPVLLLFFVTSIVTPLCFLVFFSSFFHSMWVWRFTFQSESTSGSNKQGEHASA
jgi:UPF0716 family protein affecting phage T7 exclusion